MQTNAQTMIQPFKFDLSDCAHEVRYGRLVPADHRRKFGQIFTPPKLAGLMADWVMGKSPRTLLDPAFGTGVLSAACLSHDSSLNVTAYEIDKLVLKHARDIIAEITMNNADFLRENISARYDAVIMNPPYIRHREITGYDEELKIISSMSNISIPKSANIYIYFSIKAIELLDTGGRAAILIPAEWMSANFSRKFKNYLLDRKLLKSIIMFSNCSNVFDEALTTASVILCEK